MKNPSTPIIGSRLPDSAYSIGTYRKINGDATTIASSAADAATTPRRCRSQSCQAIAVAGERMRIGSVLHGDGQPRPDAGHEDLVERRDVLLDDAGPEPGRLAGDLLDRAAADPRPLLAEALPEQRAAQRRRLRRGSSNRSVSLRCDALTSSSGPHRTTRPRSIIATWSDTRSTSSSRCDEKMTVRPSSAIVRMIAARISRLTTGSRPVEGSSRTSSSGRYASAASSPVRAFWPCDSPLIFADGSRSNRRRNCSAKPSSHAG